MNVIDTLFDGFELWHWLAFSACIGLLLLPGMMFAFQAIIYLIRDPATEDQFIEDDVTNTKTDRLLRMSNR